MSPDLFEPFRMGSLELRNRFVRSATGDGTADDSGSVTDSSVAIYEKLGRGGVGLVVTGHAFVSPAGQSSPHQYGIYNDAMIPGLRRLVEAVHKGGAKIAVQISHAGSNSKYAHQKGMVMQAVSGVPEISGIYRVMTDGDIRDVISAFVSAGRRAIEAGFDAIQLHGAHGYLMSQFLSPLYNHWNDSWGGSARKRRAFHLEVVRSMRNAIGFDFPLFIKLGARDEREGGLTLEEGLETARELAAQGIDAIEVSCGVGTSMKAARDDEPERAYFRDEAAAIKRVVPVPVIAVGGIRSLKMARDIIDSGDADLISMCRPFMSEPDLIARWQRGLKSPSTCISCNNCMAIRGVGRPLECAKNQNGQKTS
jgi:2,4-dienoyl-CoA reductase-like NADH-dependent reductase (Old Yellow Enzyme family)